MICYQFCEHTKKKFWRFVFDILYRFSILLLSYDPSDVKSRMFFLLINGVRIFNKNILRITQCTELLHRINVCFWKTSHLPLPKPNINTSRFGQNVTFGEGLVGSFTIHRTSEVVLMIKCC